ncbi:MAG: branched-chain amino acid ABC transporter permease [Variibacter sp.]
MATPRFPDMTTAGVGVALVLLPLLVPTTLASQAAIFATATLSVTLLLGSVGLLSFGQGLYLGVGSYAAGILLRDAGYGLGPSIVLAMLAGAILAGILGALIVRRQGVYFVMLTLAFAQMGYFAILAWKDVTGGENGLSGLPRTFSLFGLPVASAVSFYVLSAGTFLVALMAVQRLNASPFGTVMIAIRENEARTEAIGYDVKLYKIVALTIAGGIAGLSGALHAAFLGFVPPNNIELEMSQRILVMAIIGGVGSPAGALLGAGFYTLVSEFLSEFWARWLALIALLLIAIVLYLPGGLWSIGARLMGKRADA